MTAHIIERTELLIPDPAEALSRLLSVDLPRLETDGLPLLWHWVYLLERPRQADLGSDGHPVREVVPEPPGPGRRRMAAGGRATRLGPLLVGREATRRSEIVSTTEKDGRTGRLTFVVVQHTISQDGQVKVTEQQDIVYRDASLASPPTEGDALVFGPPTLPLEAGEWSIPIDPTLLFRFSALTYNAHRIHYDRDYARTVEGYPGLVTHGPLQALVMAESIRRRGSNVRTIDYRVVAPLFDYQGLVATNPQSGIVSIRDASGRISATGRIEVTTAQLEARLGDDGPTG